MTLLSMYKRDDSRTVYRILAEQAVQHFDHPRADADRKMLFTNLARLLERYRYDAFSPDMSPGILEVFKTERDQTRSGCRNPSENVVLDVMPALESAHAEVYDAMPRDVLVQILQGVLTQLATSRTPEELQNHDDVKRARQFFAILSSRLSEREA